MLLGIIIGIFIGGFIGVSSMCLMFYSSSSDKHIEPPTERSTETGENE